MVYPWFSESLATQSMKKTSVEAAFLDAIGTKVLRVFLLAIYSHLYYWILLSCVLEVRPARRTDASAPLSAGVASPPPPVGMGR